MVVPLALPPVAATAAWVKEPDPKGRGRRIARGARVRWLPSSKCFKVSVSLPRRPRGRKPSRMFVQVSPVMRSTDVGPMMTATLDDSDAPGVVWKSIVVNRLSCFVSNMDEAKGRFDVVMTLAPTSRTLEEAKRRKASGRRVRRGFDLMVRLA